MSGIVFLLRQLISRMGIGLVATAACFICSVATAQAACSEATADLAGVHQGLLTAQAMSATTVKTSSRQAVLISSASATLDSVQPLVDSCGTEDPSHGLLILNQYTLYRQWAAILSVDHLMFVSNRTSKCKPATVFQPIVKQWTRDATPGAHPPG
jgi:hypothetical protein